MSLAINYRLIWLALAQVSIVILVVQSEEEHGHCSREGVECLHGVCELRIAADGTEVELCICHQHYSGAQCQFSNVICSRISCKQGSFCDVDGCVCDDAVKQTGDDCSEIHCTDPDGEVLENYCKNGGVCHSGECICPNHTSGAHCELANCGDHFCSDGYCQLDRCICDVACVLGCDQTTGRCKLEADSISASTPLSTTTKIILIVVLVVVCIVILPALYAMYNMRLEHQMRNERLKSHYEMEKRYQEAYLSKNTAQPSASTRADEARNDAVDIMLTDTLAGEEGKSIREADDMAERKSRKARHSRSKTSRGLFPEEQKKGKSKRRLKKEEPRGSSTVTGSEHNATSSYPEDKKGSQPSEKRDKSSKRKSGKKKKK